MPKISALPGSPALALTSIFPEVQPASGGTTYKATFQQLLTLFQANLVTPVLGGILYTDASQVQLFAPNNTGTKMFLSETSSALTWSTISTSDITGTIDLAHGGTNANLTASNGGIFYSTATAGAILSGTATASKMLLSGATAAPTWSTSTIPTSAGATANKVLLSDGTNYVLSTPTFPNASATSGKIIISDGTNWTASTATYPATTTVSQILYSSSANAVAGLATANSAALVTTSAGVPVMSSTMTNGQVIIGSTGATPTAATLTAGTGINISNGAGSITITAGGGGTSWTTVTGTSQAMAINSGYIANNAGLVTLTLPTTAAIGDVIYIAGLGAGGWSITYSTGYISTKHNKRENIYIFECKLRVLQ